MNLSQKIRQLREKKEWSLNELAEKAGDFQSLPVSTRK